MYRVRLHVLRWWAWFQNYFDGKHTDVNVKFVVCKSITWPIDQHNVIRYTHPLLKLSYSWIHLSWEWSESCWDSRPTHARIIMFKMILKFKDLKNGYEQRYSMYLQGSQIFVLLAVGTVDFSIWNVTFEYFVSWLSYSPQVMSTIKFLIN